MNNKLNPSENILKKKIDFSHYDTYTGCLLLNAILKLSYSAFEITFWFLIDQRKCAQNMKYKNSFGAY